MQDKNEGAVLTMEEKQKNMFSCKYENEPVDLKLLLIYILKRIRFVIYFAIFGALVFASVYYLRTFVFVEERQYVATAEMYLVYADDVRLENVYINDYTWQNLVHTDRAIGYALEYIDDSVVTEEYLKNAVTAGLVSDVRFVTLKVTTDNPQRSIQIAQAYQIAIRELGEEMVDIESVSVYTQADSAEEIVADNRTIRMALTGMCIGIFLSFLGIVLQYVFDDSIYVAGQFERRYGIPVIGVCLKPKKNEQVSEYMVGQKNGISKDRLWERQVIKLNYRKLTSECKKVVVTDVSTRDRNSFAFDILKDVQMKLEQDELLAIAMGNMKDKDAFYTDGNYELNKAEAINENADAVLECAEADGVILTVQMGAHNGKLIERAMDLLTKQGCNIVGALMYDGDASLLKSYYFHALPFGNRSDKSEDEEDTEKFMLDDIF